jgi:8-oxo-dGTP pyrophosphatase MutT (NUDIX family)
MITTCGVFIFDSTDKVLICRPTGIKTKDGWSIPKGRQEKKETCLDAAIRECLEETDIDLKNYKSKFIDIGEIKYKHRKKKLHAFVVYIDKKIDPNKLLCIIQHDEKGPEIDAYEMVSPKEAIERIHSTQASLLKEYLKNRGNK